MTSSGGGRKRLAAERLVAEVLRDGPVPRSLLDRLALEQDISTRTLYRVLHATCGTFREGGSHGRHMWELDGAKLRQLDGRVTRDPRSHPLKPEEIRTHRLLGETPAEHCARHCACVREAAEEAGQSLPRMS